MTFFHQIWNLAFLIGIIGNLVASLIWAIPALRHLHKKLDRHHEEHLRAIRSHGIMDSDQGGGKNAVQHS